MPGATPRNRASCSLTGFPVAIENPEGSRTVFRTDELGRSIRIDYPNGSSLEHSLYYACPTAQDGSTETCPGGSEYQWAGCPFGPTSPARSCLVQTSTAGSDPQTGRANTSYADSLCRVAVRDGLDRVIEMYGNAGGDLSKGCTDLRQLGTHRYDDLGRNVSLTRSFGFSDPITYETTLSFDAKRRPKQMCDGRGNAHEFVRSDVAQAIKKLVNGHQHQQLTTNDSHKLTKIVDCPVVAETTATGSTCPTVASTAVLGDVSCSGDGYESHLLRDGTGTIHSITSLDTNAKAVGASIESVNGVTTYGAQNFKHDFTYTAAQPDGSDTTLSGSWERDLNGRVLSPHADRGLGELLLGRLRLRRTRTPDECDQQAVRHAFPDLQLHRDRQAGDAHHLRGRQRPILLRFDESPDTALSTEPRRGLPGPEVHARRHHREADLPDPLHEPRVLGQPRRRRRRSLDPLHLHLLRRPRLEDLLRRNHAAVGLRRLPAPALLRGRGGDGCRRRVSGDTACRELDACGRLEGHGLPLLGGRRPVSSRTAREPLPRDQCGGPLHRHRLLHVDRRGGLVRCGARERGRSLRGPGQERDPTRRECRAGGSVDRDLPDHLPVRCTRAGLCGDHGRLAGADHSRVDLHLRSL